MKRTPSSARMMPLPVHLRTEPHRFVFSLLHMPHSPQKACRMAQPFNCWFLTCTLVNGDRRDFLQDVFSPRQDSKLSPSMQACTPMVRHSSTTPGPSLVTRSQHNRANLVTGVMHAHVWKCT